MRAVSATHRVRIREYNEFTRAEAAAASGSSSTKDVGSSPGHHARGSGKARSAALWDAKAASKAPLGPARDPLGSKQEEYPAQPNAPGTRLEEVQGALAAESSFDLTSPAAQTVSYENT